MYCCKNRFVGEYLRCRCAVVEISVGGKIENSKDVEGPKDKMKRKLVIGLLVILTIAVVGLYFLIPKRIIYENYILDKDHKIAPSGIPSGTWLEKKCPNGDKVGYIDIILSKGLDSRWRKALYCKEDGIFWVADFRWGPPNEYSSMVDYYGPFEGKPYTIFFGHE